MIKIFSSLFVTMFGLGKIKVIPGTFGSLATVIFLYLLFHVLNISSYLILTGLVFVFIYSFFAVSNYIENNENKDPREIVIDEFIGQSIPVLTIYTFLEKNNLDDFILYTFTSFILFRIFDIFKPYPINKIDQNIKNGFGVILDDIVAGIYSIVILLTIIFLTNNV
jgi:phosphatidylglycerophosphatase A